MKDEGENVVAVTAVMAILIVLLVTCAGRGAFMAGMFGIVMVVVVMNMRARYIHHHMPMQSGRRRPGELERNDEHDDQCNETAHWTYSTEAFVSTKGYFIPG